MRPRYPGSTPYRTYAVGQHGNPRGSDGMPLKCSHCSSTHHLWHKCTAQGSEEFKKQKMAGKGKGKGKGGPIRFSTWTSSLFRRIIHYMHYTAGAFGEESVVATEPSMAHNLAFITTAAQSMGHTMTTAMQKITSGRQQLALHQSTSTSMWSFEHRQYRRLITRHVYILFENQYRHCLSYCLRLTKELEDFHHHDSRLMRYRSSTIMPMKVFQHYVIFHLRPDRVDNENFTGGTVTIIYLTISLKPPLMPSDDWTDMQSKLEIVEEHASSIRLSGTTNAESKRSSLRRPLKDDFWDNDEHSVSTSAVSRQSATTSAVSHQSAATAATICDSTVSSFSPIKVNPLMPETPTLNKAEDAEQTTARRWWCAPMYYKHSETSEEHDSEKPVTQHAWHELTRLSIGDGEGLLIDPGAFDNLQGSAWTSRQEKLAADAGLPPGVTKPRTRSVNVEGAGAGVQSARWSKSVPGAVTDKDAKCHG
eukprot:3047049-Amphidinium_carterae.3